eukprot:327831-Chlamydomonas_euryale.AAC.2
MELVWLYAPCWVCAAAAVGERVEAGTKVLEWDKGGIKVEQRFPGRSQEGRRRGLCHLGVRDRHREASPPSWTPPA